MDITYQYYPRNRPLPKHLHAIANVFQSKSSTICSSSNNLQSDQVLGKVSPGLSKLGYAVESNKIDTIDVPVMYGMDGSIDKSFQADA